MKQKTARDLLFLERTSQVRELTNEELEQWHDLARILFSHIENAEHKRKATRLTIKTEATAEINGKIHNCSITELSQVNLTLSYDDFDDIGLGDYLVLKTVLVNGAFITLNLKCKIMRLRTDENGKPSAGLEVAADAPKEINRIFFQNIYYPLYIKFLENIAAGTP